VNANWGIYDECPHSSNTNDNGTMQDYKEFQGGPGYPQFVEFTQTFTYDGLNRLTSANDSGGWSRNFNYDQWGNSWVTGATGPLAGNTPTSNVYNGKNQIGSYNYDAAGNLTTLNGNTPSYDAENRMTALAATGGGAESILYDAVGQRVQKTVGGSTTVYVYESAGRPA
jgi:YD repeat-containing protein